VIRNRSNSSCQLRPTGIKDIHSDVGYGIDGVVYRHTHVACSSYLLAAIASRPWPVQRYSNCRHQRHISHRKDEQHRRSNPSVDNSTHRAKSARALLRIAPIRHRAFCRFGAVTRLPRPHGPAGFVFGRPRSPAPSPGFWWLAARRPS
jgi:hypothetical protein